MFKNKHSTLRTYLRSLVHIKDFVQMGKVIMPYVFKTNLQHLNRKNMRKRLNNLQKNKRKRKKK